MGLKKRFTNITYFSCSVKKRKYHSVGYNERIFSFKDTFDFFINTNLKYKKQLNYGSSGKTLSSLELSPI